MNCWWTLYWIGFVSIPIVAVAYAYFFADENFPTTQALDIEGAVGFSMAIIFFWFIYPAVLVVGLLVGIIYGLTYGFVAAGNAGKARRAAKKAAAAEVHSPRSRD